ncbi:MAG TPA: ATP-binding protein [Steroidobacteraceae bacterium]|nr:ATP-binding protein [Steroidobacteraceae bacterium]
MSATVLPEVFTAGFLAEALDSAPDAIVIADPGGCIRYANSQVRTLLGYEPAELIGQSIEQLLPERLRARHVTHRAHYVQRPSARPMGTGLDLYALRKDGTEVPVEISLSPIRTEGARELNVAALRDASESRRNRKELIEARESADRANQAKSRFLATASHDLRQPLQTLALLNGALRRLIADPDAVEALVHQDQAIAAMSRLLNALLDISKLESGAIRPDPRDFPVSALFEEMRREFSSLASGKGLELRTVPSSACAHSDRALVGQIVRNLLSNAVKYTARGAVELRCIPAAQTVQIAVVDSGIGIPADQLEHIFEEFYQVGVASNTTREGYGLGLSIVRRVVALLGLKITVTSELGRGTTFTLELPRGGGGAVESARASALPDARRAPASAPLVLLVDDDPGVRGATAMLLKVEGYRVVTAASLAEAAARARDNPGIALLMTDYHLREGDTGTQVIAAVRAAVGRELPTVLISGDTSSTVRDLKADDRVHLVSKPIDAEQLLALLKTLLPA